MILTFQFANNSSKSNSAERLADQFNSQPVKKVHQDHNEQRHSEHREENKGETFIYVNPSKECSIRSVKLQIQDGTVTLQILKNSEDLNIFGSRNPEEDKQVKLPTDRFVSNVRETQNELWAGKNGYIKESDHSPITNDSDETSEFQGSATTKKPSLPVRDIYNEELSDKSKNESQRPNFNERDSSFNRFKNELCYRCGYTGHLQGFCKEKYHRNGNLIPDPCLRCGKTNHITEKCLSIKDVYGKLLPQ